MEREQIIRMAREAGLERNGYWEFDMNRLERFVAIIAAAEREACAKAVEVFDKTFQTGGGIAGAIRARGNT